MNSKTLDTLVDSPASPAPERPWAWRPEFRGAFDAVDQRLLEAGWHLLYLRLEDNYGSPFARAEFARFLDEKIASRSLAPRGVFIGLSRGGLSALHVAIDRPDLCQALYLDNPVCDFCSWPGGQDGGPGSSEDWGKLLLAYQLEEKPARSWNEQPLHRLTSEFIQQTPLALVGGDADEIVPWKTNGATLAQRWKQDGGQLHLEIKPGALHHPHGPTNPATVFEFLINLKANNEHP